MVAFTTFLAVLSLLSAAVVTAFDGFDLGNWRSRTFDLGTKVNPIDSLSPYHLRVTFPTTCTSSCGPFQEGGFPVFLFVTAFAGTMDAFKYDVVMTGIARHGVIVVAVDQDLGFSLTIDYSKLATNLQKVIGFIRQTGEGGLLAEMQARGFTRTILNNAQRIIFGGHSSGAHIAVRNIKENTVRGQTCPDAGGVVLFSPMDGADPLGFSGDFVIQEGKPLPFSAPALLVSGSLDGESSQLTQGAPCTPDDRGNKHYYEAWVGAINWIKADNMGTLDVLNEAAETTYKDLCAASPPANVNERRDYRTMVRGAVVSFIQGVVLNDQNYIDKLETQRDLEFPSVTEKRGSGRAFSCSYVPVPETMAFELQLGLILFGVLFALTFVTGLYIFFRKMDDDTLHRYHPAEGVGYEQPASFQTKLEPQYGVSGQIAPENPYQQQASFSMPNSRAPSINV